MENISNSVSNNTSYQSQPINSSYNNHYTTSEGKDLSAYGVGIYPAVPNVYPINSSYPIQQQNGQYPGLSFQQQNSQQQSNGGYQQNISNSPSYLATNSIKAVLSNGSTDTSSNKQVISLQSPPINSNDKGYKVPGRVTPKTPITIPEPPKSFPELEKLTTTQLERLNSDTAALEVYQPTSTNLSVVVLLLY